MAASLAHTVAAQARAEAILRDRLTPGQRADADANGWFNVRDARGSLWRVHAGLGLGPPKDGCGCESCYRGSFADFYPNLTDEGGAGRTMLHPVLPPPDQALALLLQLGDHRGAVAVQYEACRSPRRSLLPHHPLLRAHYQLHDELALVTPGSLPPPPLGEPIRTAAGGAQVYVRALGGAFQHLGTTMGEVRAALARREEQIDNRARQLRSDDAGR